ncbi:calcitonin/calcitonin-related polypeptide, alpha isoform 1-T1 [Synchiropus picturatus]
MLKLWSFTFAFVLTVCQMYMTQAAPSRMTFDDLMDGVTISNDDPQRLIKVIKELMQKTLDEQELAAADVNSQARPVFKRCTGLSTCVLGKLSQDIHKLQTYPRTDVGAGTPGKKRSLSEQFENYGNSYD